MHLKIPISRYLALPQSDSDELAHLGSQDRVDTSEGSPYTPRTSSSSRHESKEYLLRPESRAREGSHAGRGDPSRRSGVFAEYDNSDSEEVEGKDHAMRRRRKLWALSSALAALILVVAATVAATSRQKAYAISSDGEVSQNDTSSTITTGIAQQLATIPSELHEQGWEAFDATLSDPAQSRRRPLRPLRAQQALTPECAESWIAGGELCDDIVSRKSLQNSEIDVVWTWVAENPHWLAWRDVYVKEPAAKLRRWIGQVLGYSPRNKRSVVISGPGAGPGRGNRKTGASAATEKHFRSHHEFRFSQRSVLANLPAVRKLHLMASDLPICAPIEPSCQAENSGTRIGETPIWLNVSMIGSGDSKFNVQHHWDLFKASGKDAQSWRSRVLPTFNSLSIESQLSNVNDAAETVLYMNDDMYLLRPMSSADIASPLFGPVFRVQSDLLVRGEAPGTSTSTKDGEWPNMGYSNWLLDERFGRRSRPYLIHVAKAISTPLLDEIVSIWADEFQSTAEIRFRGKDGVEVNTLLLSTYYVVERHREALLWSYFVAKSDTSGTGQYSLRDRQAIVATILGKEGSNGRDVDVEMPSRFSFAGNNAISLLQQAKLDAPKETDVAFSSMNGYPLGVVRSGRVEWPNYDKNPEGSNSNTICTINFEHCFGSSDYASPNFEGDISSASLFKRFAFEKPECGDCAILRLLGQSGKRGLEAFLPAKVSQRSKVDTKIEVPPMLGDLAKTWQETDFSVKAVLGENPKWSSRDYAIRLIQRYSYALGDSPTRFVSLRSLQQTIRDLNSLSDSLSAESGPALIVLNDDILGTRFIENINVAIDDWHGKTWPDKSPYEVEEPLEEALEQSE